MLTALSYMFDRDDWQRAIEEASMTPLPLAPGDLVVTHNPFAGKQPKQFPSRSAHSGEPPVEGFVTGDF